MRLLSYLLLHVATISGLYFGYYQDVENARRLVLFLTWMPISTTPFIFTKAIKEDREKKGRLISPYIDIPLDVCYIGVFVWYGSLVTGICLLLHVMLNEGIWKGIENGKKEKKKQI
jgi:hypothetical protein